MSQAVTSMKQPQHDANGTRVDMKLEVDIIPVADIERSKQFYQHLGWRLDGDDAPMKDLRIVQFTPPGSDCSVTFGKGIAAAAPGSAGPRPLARRLPPRFHLLDRRRGPGAWDHSEADEPTLPGRRPMPGQHVTHGRMAPPPGHRSRHRIDSRADATLDPIHRTSRSSSDPPPPMVRRSRRRCEPVSALRQLHWLLRTA